MGDLRVKAMKDLNFEPKVIFTDQFKNIILDSVDIIQALFPFYKFQVKDHYPLIYAILPYGWSGTDFVSKGDAKIREFVRENTQIQDEFNTKVKLRVESCNPKITATDTGPKKERQENLAKIIFFFLKKTGRMLYMITIIAAYWIVFVPRMKIFDSLKFLNAVQLIENTVNTNMKASQQFDFKTFSSLYFNSLETSDAVNQNALLSKMAIFQRRYPSQVCTSFSTTTKSFIEDNKDKFKCSQTTLESKAAYGDSSDGFTYTTFPGITFSTFGKEYTTENGFYMFVDTGNPDLSKASEILAEKVDKGWVDSYTNYVGFILNLYQPNFQLLMIIVAIYDSRFGYDILVLSANQDQHYFPLVRDSDGLLRHPGHHLDRLHVFGLHHLAGHRLQRALYHQDRVQLREAGHRVGQEKQPRSQRKDHGENQNMV